MDILDRLDHIVCAICGCREMRALHQFAGVVLVTRYLVIAAVFQVDSVCFQSLKMNIDLFIGRKFSPENMDDNSTTPLPFCLTPLWDMDLTWNTDNPDFTRYSYLEYLLHAFDLSLQVYTMIKSGLN